MIPARNYHAGKYMPIRVKKNPFDVNHKAIKE